MLIWRIPAPVHDCALLIKSRVFDDGVAIALDIAVEIRNVLRDDRASRS